MSIGGPGAHVLTCWEETQSHIHRCRDMYKPFFKCYMRRRSYAVKQAPEVIRRDLTLVHEE